MREFKINPERLKIYRDYQYERANIYYKKEILKEPKPWTDYPILQKYKFTNVHRRTDRESKFLIETVCENNTLSLDEKILNCALFRFLNCKTACLYLQGEVAWPVKFDSLSLDGDYWSKCFELENAYASSGDVGPMQSNAYFLSLVRKVAYAFNESLRGSNTCMVYYILANAETILTASTLEPKQAIEKLKTIKGFGEFFAYQIWEDWTYIPEYPYHDNDYVNCGPGAIEGIDWLIDNCEVVPSEEGKPTVRYNLAGWSQEDYNEWLIWFTENIEQIMAEHGLEFDPAKILHYMPDPRDRTWSLGTSQNSMCESNKHNKLLNGCVFRVRNYDGSN